jgi:uncharacterized membrane protein
MSYLIIGLSGIGLYISAYFTLVYYGVIKPSTSLVPSFCRMEDQTCFTVIQTPYARVFKVPNFVLGMIYYTVLIVLASSGWLTTVSYLAEAVGVIAWGTVLLGIYLTYALLYRVKIPCPLCYTSHVINLVLAILIAVISDQ